MDVKQMIKILSKFPPDKIVIISDSDGRWDNIGEIIESNSEVKITFDENSIFQD